VINTLVSQPPIELAQMAILLAITHRALAARPPPHRLSLVSAGLTAAQVKSMLRASADAIGRVPYVAGRNDFHGYGRVNMYGALLLAQGSSLSSQSPSCSADAFDYSVASDLLLPRYRPQPTEFCPAIGPLPQSDEFCVPIKASNGAIAVFCL